MATAVIPGSGSRSLLGKIFSAVAGVKRGRSRRFAELAAAARKHVVTVAALASVDIGAFHGGQIAGWVVTGVSLLALDFAITG